MKHLSKESIVTSKITKIAEVTVLIDSDDYNYLVNAQLSCEIITPFALDGNLDRFVVTRGQAKMDNIGYLCSVFYLNGV